MGTTLQHGIFLPAEGERNCYAGLASNWTILDGIIGGYSSHTGDTTIHVTAADKQTWNAVTSKADASALTAHTGNTTIHVTAADKEAWNGKADASALTAHTGNTTIHVTAADKSKWDAVTSKANDADAVHKSGEETIGGPKTFTSNFLIYNSDPTAYASYLNLKNQRNARGSSATGSQGIQYQDKNNKTLTMLESRVVSNGNTVFNIICYNIDGNNQPVSDGVSVIKTPTITNFAPTTDNAVTSGRSLAKWSDVQTYKVNALEPSSLSLPDLNNGIDISGYITDLTGASGTNKFTPSVNGWVSIGLSNADFIEIYIPSFLMGGTFTKSTTFNYSQAFMPVIANKEVRFALKGSSIGWAKFYPCQGNI